MTDDVMSKLKAETRDEHKSVERTPLARAMFGGHLTRIQYKTQLATYRRILDALERRLAVGDRVVASVVAAELPGAKTARLDKDLSALYDVPIVSTPALETVVDAFCTWMSRMEGAALLGVLYVFEGSAIGATILRPRIQAALHLPDDALHYYRGHGPATMTQWEAFGARMNGAISSEALQVHTVDAARWTFVTIQQIFEAIGAIRTPTLRPDAPMYAS